ncbi:hypothetical protein BD309DRAFT_197455 [Dichomitus squalens]|nr:hypothetical protein BD309DRAFT_197455 [Dichomitus squalens]
MTSMSCTLTMTAIPSYASPCLPPYASRPFHCLCLIYPQISPSVSLPIPSRSHHRLYRTLLSRPVTTISFMLSSQGSPA